MNYVIKLIIKDAECLFENTDPEDNIPKTVSAHARTLLQTTALGIASTTLFAVCRYTSLVSRPWKPIRTKCSQR